MMRALAPVVSFGRTVFVTAALALLAAQGCRDGESRGGGPAGSGGGSAGPAALAPSPAQFDAAVAGVDAVLRDPSAHAGRLGVQGVVIQAFPERGAFVMVDAREFASCGLAGCTDATLPVRFETAGFDGGCPLPGQAVTVLGELEVQERGFRLAVDQVHSDGSLILARRPADAARD